MKATMDGEREIGTRRFMSATHKQTVLAYWPVYSSRSAFLHPMVETFESDLLDVVLV